MFLPPILFPACNLSSPAFLMICSAYRLKKQSDSRQLCCTPFSILNQSFLSYRVLTVVSWPTYRFLRRQVRWSGIPISLRAFCSLLWSTQSRLWHSQWNRGRCFFLEFPSLLYHSANGDLISGSSSFSKPSLDIWMFFVCIMLKSRLQDFKHNLTSMGDGSNCLMVSTFFSTTLLENWDEDWPFPVLWPLLGLPGWLTYWMQHPDGIIL